ncbi:pyridoxal-phosphate dependent enzyme [Streptomyces sp. NPDC001941]|uniref:pyridoxal-phosphate dependent enzyme n=1 Tax=Streptomyces sp. NPDC001941 TaxID=3154659 RepID=UPI00332287D7
MNEIYREDASIVLRYAHHLKDVDRTSLEQVSRREGARIVGLGRVRQTDLYALDMSTLSTNGTFKDWVATLAVARARATGRTRILFQSSGNTANALTSYAAHAGLHSLGLYPPTSRGRIHGALAGPGHEFVEIDTTESRIKEILGDVSRDTGVPALPTLEDQYAGNKLRARFVRDAEAHTGIHWNWHVQALSSAYGPLGFYRGLAEMGGPTHQWPHFLGIQQEAVHPFADALSGTPRSDPSGRMLEPTLFRRILSKDLVEEVRGICQTTAGHVRVLSDAHYLAREAEALDRLHDAGIHICLTPEGEPYERAGLYSLLGALDAIRDGIILPGSSVLIAHTGGAGYCRHTPYQPEHILQADTAAPQIAKLLDGQKR